MRLEVNLKGPAGLMRELVYRMGGGGRCGGGAELDNMADSCMDRNG